MITYDKGITLTYAFLFLLDEFFSDLRGGFPKKNLEFTI
jgi:hypothetical protein